MTGLGGGEKVPLGDGKEMDGACQLNTWSKYIRGRFSNDTQISDLVILEWYPNFWFSNSSKKKHKQTKVTFEMKDNEFHLVPDESGLYLRLPRILYMFASFVDSMHYQLSV